MATAAELLNDLSVTNSEVEGHIIIGNDRRIIVPTELKRIAVQYDHDVETVIFDCPRYWDNLDMSKMAIYINYMRSDGYADSYPVKNVTIDETNNNIIHFEWTISRNVSKIKGNIKFLVCIKNTDTDGNEINHWNTELCQDMFVSEGMETEEQIADLSSDLVTQLLLTIEKIKDYEDGATFTPLISEDGVLSWTNDQNLPNPKPVNIMGPKGDKGDSVKVQLITWEADD